MQEELVLLLIKEDDVFIEIFSGTEDELSNIKESIKDLLDSKEIKQTKVNKEYYISCKNDIDKLQELYKK